MPGRIQHVPHLLQPVCKQSSYIGMKICMTWKMTHLPMHQTQQLVKTWGRLNIF
ncbi:hypothetical protein PVAP13_2KG075716 [Panicum virgatum]|uniref:Uncharacterized protein n=1 Tax=Panicum virgatum TaxID=38727 RepID=A0A8T0WE13_PANVG|nr:hypothetical protein PVAP13_2KG075716 [Panicum virgatum]